MMLSDRIFPSMIIPNLYLGSVDVAVDEIVLESFGIRIIIICANELEACFPEKFKYLKIGIGDPNINHNELFEISGKLINESLLNNEGVLVHCYSGISRSTVVVCGYLVRYEGMCFEKACELVKSSRKVADCHTFLNLIEDYLKFLNHH